jgi:hypothetical protein
LIWMLGCWVLGCFPLETELDVMTSSYTSVGGPYGPPTVGINLFPGLMRIWEQFLPKVLAQKASVEKPQRSVLLCFD